MRIKKLIASGLGTGYSPIAPGTVGSLLGIITCYGANLVMINNDLTRLTVLALNLFAIVCILFIGIHSIRIVQREWVHDSPKIVIDEILGVWISAFALPFEWHYFVFAFILFRFFDIVKPFFIRRVDQLKNTWSVMLDDALAGVYTILILQSLIFFKVL